MFSHAFPVEASIGLSRSSAEGEGGHTSLAKSKLGCAYALLGYALYRLSDQPDPEHPEAEQEAAADDAHAATAAEPDEPRKKGRKKKDESGFSASDPGAIVEALAAHARARLKQGGAEVPPPVPPRVIAEYCLKLISDEVG